MLDGNHSGRGISSNQILTRHKPFKVDYMILGVPEDILLQKRFLTVPHANGTKVRQSIEVQRGYLVVLVWDPLAFSNLLRCLELKERTLA